MSVSHWTMQSPRDFSISYTNCRGFPVLYEFAILLSMNLGVVLFATLLFTQCRFVKGFEWWGWLTKCYTSLLYQSHVDVLRTLNAVKSPITPWWMPDWKLTIICRHYINGKHMKSTKLTQFSALNVLLIDSLICITWPSTCVLRISI